MKKIRFRRVTAAILALLIVTSTTALPSAFEGVELIRPAITAHAEGTATLSEDGKTLTLSGVVSKEDVRALCTENNKNTTVTTIIASERTVLPENCSSMFRSFTAVTSIDLSNADTSSVTKMQYMFYGCTDLTTLNLSGFDTSNVTDMSNMFYCCEALTSLNLSGFDTSNVTDMSNMFYCCEALTTLDLSSFDTRGVTDMSNMFHDCQALTTLDLSSFDTRGVTDMRNMFFDCESLTTLDLSSFDTSKVTDMLCMFGWCEKLTALDLSGFDTSSVTDMYCMFFHCNALTTLDLSSFDTSKVKDMSYMFYICTNLKDIIIGDGWKTDVVINSDNMFNGCPFVPENGATDATNAYFGNGGYLSPTYTLSEDGTTLTLRGHVSKAQVRALYTENNTKTTVTTIIASEGTVLPADCSELFHSFTAVTSIDLSNADTRNVTDMSKMFYNCTNLTALDLSGFNTGKVENMNSMFGWCENLTALDLSSFDTSSVTNMYGMFYCCEALTTLDLSSFDTSSVTNMYGMFYYCEALTTLDLSSFDTSKVTDMRTMFGYCKMLTALDLSSFDTSSVTNMYCMFNGCQALTTLDLSSFDTSSVTCMSDMFNDCKALTTLDLSSFNTQSVNQMQRMFQNCTALKDIIIGEGWKTDAVTSSSDMFLNCTLLPGYNANNVTAAYAKLTTDGGYLYAPVMLDGTTLTLRGHVSKAQVRGLCTNDENTTVTTITAAEGTVLPADSRHLFWNFTAAESIDLSNADTGSVTNMYGMFSGCTALTDLTFGEKFDTGNVTDMDDMFSGCTALETLDLSSFDTGSVTWMGNMFNECAALETLDLSSFDTKNVTNMRNMFSGCAALQTLDLSSFDISTITVTEEMLADCFSLESLTLGAGIGVTADMELLHTSTAKWTVSGEEYVPVSGTGSFAVIEAPAAKTVYQKLSNFAGTPADLQTLAAKGGEVVLYADIDIENQFALVLTKNTTLDLNGHKLTGEVLMNYDTANEAYPTLTVQDPDADTKLTLQASEPDDAPGKLTVYGDAAVFASGEPTLVLTPSKDADGNDCLTMHGVLTENDVFYGGLILSDLANETFTYNGEAQTVNGINVWFGARDLIAGEDYTVTYANNTDAGTASVTVEGKGFFDGKVTQDFTIQKADITNVTAPTANKLTYDGTAQALINAGSAVGGTLEYSLDGENFSEKIPTGMDAGDYTVYYRVTGDETHKDIEGDSLTVNIAKADASVTKAPIAKTLSYDGTAQALVTAGTATGGTLVYSLDNVNYSEEIPTGTAPDQYIVCYKVVGDNNHNDVAPKMLYVTIEKADSTVTAPTANKLTYSGEAQALVTAGSAVGGTMEYSLDGADFSEDIPAVSNAGEYKVFYKVIGDDNHNGAAAKYVTVNVAKREITVTAENKSSDYGKPLAELTYTITGEVVKGDDLEITLTCDAKPDVSGTSEIEVTYAADENYSVTVKGGIYTVGEAPATEAPTTEAPQEFTEPAQSSTEAPATTTETPQTTEPVATTDAPQTTTEPVATTAAPQTTEPTATTAAPQTTEPTTTTTAPQTTEPAVTTAAPQTTEQTVTTAASQTTELTVTTAASQTTELTATTTAPQTTTEPATTNEAPQTTTEPAATTTAPQTTTEPVKTTDAPQTTTESAATTEAPQTTTELVATSTAPQTTTESTPATTETSQTTIETTVTTSESSEIETTTTTAESSETETNTTTIETTPAISETTTESTTTTLPETRPSIELTVNTDEPNKVEAVFVPAENINERGELSLKTEDGMSVTFDASAAQEIADATDGKAVSVKIETLDIEKLDAENLNVPAKQIAEIKQAVENGAVILDLSLVDADGKKVAFTDGGSVTIEMPYVSENGEAPTVYCLMDDGKFYAIPTTYDPATQTISFNLNAQNTTPASPTKTLGDADGNGVVDALDATEMLLYAAAQGAGETYENPAFVPESADTDGNGTIDAVDASNVLIYAAIAGAEGSADWADVLGTNH